MSFQRPETQWFVAQFKPNCADIARRNLLRQGFQCFLPMQEITRRRSGRFVKASVPLFPGYLFLSVSPHSQRLGAVNGTHGITRLVSQGGSPAPVPEDFIRALTGRCDERGILQPRREFSPGEEVTITAGPLTDFIARVEKVDAERRVWLLLDILGRETRISADAEALR
ncbi:transcription termination/antitermination protein NusG [Thioclava atlantica]|uniref:transcription termination/antitermination protein NusG n=1 Tax=Thioclava atlantica TaxID=1317124 RepID=UPI000571E1A5|nr:transcription termination/antitermination NusG family protein [Thioclava atlantica]